jgi:hypothetical protein
MLPVLEKKAKQLETYSTPAALTRQALALKYNSGSLYFKLQFREI